MSARAWRSAAECRRRQPAVPSSAGPRAAPVRPPTAKPRPGSAPTPSSTPCCSRRPPTNRRLRHGKVSVAGTELPRSQAHGLRRRTPRRRGIYQPALLVVPGAGVAAATIAATVAAVEADPRSEVDGRSQLRSPSGFGGNGCPATGETGEDELIGMLSSPRELLPP